VRRPFRRFLVAALVGAALLPAAADAAPSWQPPKFLSANGEAERSDDGRLGFDSTGHTFAAWGVPSGNNFDSPVSGIRFAQLDTATDTWGPREVVTDAAGIFGTELVVDPSGNATVTWAQGQDPMIFAAYRPAGGGWSTPQPVSASGAIITSAGDLVFDDAGRVTVAWTSGHQGCSNPDNDPGQCVLMASKPVGSAAFGNPSVVLDEVDSDLDDFRLVSDSLLDFAVDPGTGTLHAAIETAEPSTARYALRMMKKPLGGAWDPPGIALTDPSNDNSRSAFVDANGGNAAVIFDYSSGPGDTTLEIAYQSGSSWSEHVLASDPNSGPHDNFNPHALVGLDADGVATAMWKEGACNQDPQSIHVATGTGTTYSEQVLDNLPTQSCAWDPAPVALRVDDDGKALATWAIDTVTTDTNQISPGVKAALRSATTGTTFGAGEQIHDQASNAGTGHGYLVDGGAHTTTDRSLGFDSDGMPIALQRDCLSSCFDTKWLVSTSFREAPAAPPTQRTLNVGKAGTGGGTVTGSGINCGGDCSQAFDQNTTVAVTASPAAGSTFSGWTGCDSVVGLECQVNMGSDRTVTATFTQQGGTTPPPPALTVHKAGTGSGTVTSNPGGIDCGADCSESYGAGTSVTLEATPDPGSQFAGWAGCDSFAGGDCTVSMTSAREVTASFEPAPSTGRSLYVGKSGSGHGAVTGAGVTGAGITCPVECSSAFRTFDLGETVTLTASPAPGSDLTGWLGCDSVSGGGSVCQVTMNDHRVVGAVFDAEPAPGLPNTTITKVKVDEKKGAAKVSFEGSGGTGDLHFECKLDGGGFKPCDSAKKFAPKPGKHTVEVMAIDSTNAEDPTPAKAKFKIPK
jgi:hypothetical protein